MVAPCLDEVLGKLRATHIRANECPTEEEFLSLHEGEAAYPNDHIQLHRVIAQLLDIPACFKAA